MHEESKASQIREETIRHLGESYVREDLCHLSDRLRSGFQAEDIKENWTLLSQQIKFTNRSLPKSAIRVFQEASVEGGKEKCPSILFRSGHEIHAFVNKRYHHAIPFKQASQPLASKDAYCGKRVSSDAHGHVSEQYSSSSTIPGSGYSLKLKSLFGGFASTENRALYKFHTNYNDLVHELEEDSQFNEAEEEKDLGKNDEDSSIEELSEEEDSASLTPEMPKSNGNILESLLLLHNDDDDTNVEEKEMEWIGKDRLDDPLNMNCRQRLMKRDSIFNLRHLMEHEILSDEEEPHNSQFAEHLETLLISEEGPLTDGTTATSDKQFFYEDVIEEESIVTDSSVSVEEEKKVVEEIEDLLEETKGFREAKSKEHSLHTANITSTQAVKVVEKIFSEEDEFEDSEEEEISIPFYVTEDEDEVQHTVVTSIEIPVKEAKEPEQLPMEPEEEVITDEDESKEKEPQTISESVQSESDLDEVKEILSNSYEEARTIATKIPTDAWPYPKFPEGERRIIDHEFGCLTDSSNTNYELFELPPSSLPDKQEATVTFNDVSFYEEAPKILTTRLVEDVTDGSWSDRSEFCNSLKAWFDQHSSISDLVKNEELTTTTPSEERLFEITLTQEKRSIVKIPQAHWSTVMTCERCYLNAQNCQADLQNSDKEIKTSHSSSHNYATENFENHSTASKSFRRTSLHFPSINDYDSDLMLEAEEDLEYDLRDTPSDYHPRFHGATLGKANIFQSSVTGNDDVKDSESSAERILVRNTPPTANGLAGWINVHLSNKRLSNERSGDPDGVDAMDCLSVTFQPLQSVSLNPQSVNVIHRGTPNFAGHVQATETRGDWNETYPIGSVVIHSSKRPLNGTIGEGAWSLNGMPIRNTKVQEITKRGSQLHLRSLNHHECAYDIKMGRQFYSDYETETRSLKPNANGNIFITDDLSYYEKGQMEVHEVKKNQPPDNSYGKDDEGKQSKQEKNDGKSGNSNASNHKGTGDKRSQKSTGDTKRGRQRTSQNVSNRTVECESCAVGCESSCTVDSIPKGILQCPNAIPVSAVHSASPLERSNPIHPDPLFHPNRSRIHETSSLSSTTIPHLLSLQLWSFILMKAFYNYSVKWDPSGCVADCELHHRMFSSCNENGASQASLSEEERRWLHEVYILWCHVHYIFMMRAASLLNLSLLWNIMQNIDNSWHECGLQCNHEVTHWRTVSPEDHVSSLKESNLHGTYPRRWYLSSRQLCIILVVLWTCWSEWHRQNSNFETIPSRHSSLLGEQELL